MEAEYNKRKQAKAEKDSEESKVFFDKLTKNEDGSCKHIHTTLNGGECFDCGENLNSTNSSQLEWQPDWSVAPKWANWWAMDGDCCCYWHSCVDSPFINSGIFEIANPQGHTSDAPLFNYQGDWKDSLRKRPK